MLTGKKNLASVVALLLAMAVAMPTWGASEFLFNGYAKYWDGQVPDAVGSTMEVYGILSTVWEVPPPITLDLDNYQYTVYVATMNVSLYNNVPAVVKTIDYNGGEIHIFADPIAGGTPADYAVPATFMDGDLILQATVDDGWEAVLYDFDSDLIFSGSGGGTCDFIGGSRLGDLAAAEYYLNDWGFFGTPVADPNPPYLTVPDGYHRVFDVKIATTHDPTPSEDSSWGQVKNLYR